MHNTRIQNAKDLGAVIRRSRRAQALRQDELAGVAGVGIRFVVELEAGKSTAQIGKILQVLHALGIRVDLSGPLSEDPR